MKLEDNYTKTQEKAKEELVKLAEHWKKM